MINLKTKVWESILADQWFASSSWELEVCGYIWRIEIIILYLSWVEYINDLLFERIETILWKINWGESTIYICGHYCAASYTFFIVQELEILNHYWPGLLKVSIINPIQWLKLPELQFTTSWSKINSKIAIWFTLS